MFFDYLQIITQLLHDYTLDNCYKKGYIHNYIKIMYIWTTHFYIYPFNTIVNTYKIRNFTFFYYCGNNTWPTLQRSRYNGCGRHIIPQSTPNSELNVII